MKSLQTVLLLSFVLSGLPVQAQSRANVTRTNQPNIIFILADDLGYGDIGVFFQNLRKEKNDVSEPWFHTPNLDQLAAAGAMLTHHYCPAPVCAPSRASFLLGLNQGHANVRDNQFDKALQQNHNVANTLKKIGYTAAAFGKWGLQGAGNQAPNWPAHPLNRGFDYYFGYMRHADGHEHYPKEGLYRGKKEVWDNRTNITEQLDACYTTDLWTARSKKWIIDHQKQNAAKPFFIYLAYETPHAVLELPTQPYPQGRGVQGGVQWTGTSGHMINTASGKVDSWIHPDYAQAMYDHDKIPSTARQPWPDVYKRYATSVRRIDDAVGDLMQLLKDLGIDKNTLVVFTSDNGPSIESYLPEKITPDFFNSFGPFDGIKRDVFEGGVRIPAIANWPARIPSNSVVTTPGALYDWLPTFTDAAGYPAPANTDGVSLLPSLTRSGKQKDGLVYIEYFQNQSSPAFEEFHPSHRNRKRNQMQLIRFGDTVGVRYDIQSATDDFEIYDVVRDPQQTKNLAPLRSSAIIQQRMKDRTLQVRKPDAGASRPYDSAFVPAVAVSKTSSGVHCTFYAGKFPWVPEITRLKSSGNKKVKTMAAAVSGKQKEGLLFVEGYIHVPAADEYTFYLTAAQHAVLKIHAVTVVDADFGYEPGNERSGKIRLAAGLHPFRLYYTVKDGDNNGFALAWQSSHFGKEEIPASAFRR